MYFLCSFVRCVSQYVHCKLNENLSTHLIMSLVEVKILLEKSVISEFKF